jgi:hypothetical protein
MSHYAHIFDQIWRDKKFRQLDDSGQKLFIALITSPSSNMIGYYNWTFAYALHDLGWDEAKFRKNMTDLENLGLAYYDYDAEVVFVRNFLKYNKVETIKQVVGAYSQAKSVPSSPLFQRFYQAWRTHAEDTYRESAAERLSEANDEAREGQINRSIAELNRVSKGMQKILYSTDTPIGLHSDTPIGLHSDTPINTVTDRGMDIQQQQQQQHTAAVTDPPPTSPESEEGGGATIGKVISLWNDKLGPLGFPKVQKSTPERERHFKARLVADKRRHSLAWWGEQFEYMSQSGFLLDSAKEKAPWLTFDWILNENNIVKILERKYRIGADPPRGNAAPQADDPKPKTYEEAKALAERRKQREPPGPRTYEEAKALERGVVIDADFRTIGGDSS